MKKRIIHSIICGCFLAALAVGQVVCTTPDEGQVLASNEVQDQVDEDTSDDFEDEVKVEEGSVSAEDGEEIILPDDVPLGPNNSKSTTTTETLSKKTTTSTKTLSAKSTRSGTLKQTNVRWKTVSSSSRKARIRKKTTTTTVKKTTYKKGSKKAKVKKTVTKVLETTTIPAENGEYDIAQYATKADSSLIKAFKKNGFTYTIDNGLSTTGVFSPTRKLISLSYHSDVVYHELGHYLGYVTGKSDKTDEFGKIYDAEKDDYDGENVSYAKKTQAEFFAECYRMYCTDKSGLKKCCPKTYAFIKEQLEKL